MTFSSRIVATTGNNSNADNKVEGVPRLVSKNHTSKKGMATTTASASWGTDENNAKGKTEPQQLQEALSFREVAEKTFDLPYHEINYMPGQHLRDRADRMVLEAFIKSKTLTNQCYTTSARTTVVKRKLIQVNKKWTQKNTQAQQPHGIKFIFQPTTTTTKTAINTIFVFGAGSGGVQVEHVRRNGDQEKDPNLKRGKNKSQKPNQRHKRKKEVRRTNNYEIRQVERKKEEEMKKKANRIKWKISHKETEEVVPFWSKNNIKLSLKPERKVPRNTKSRMKRNKTNNAVKRRRRK